MLFKTLIMFSIALNIILGKLGAQLGYQVAGIPLADIFFLLGVFFLFFHQRMECELLVCPIHTSSVFSRLFIFLAIYLLSVALFFDHNVTREIRDSAPFLYLLYVPFLVSTFLSLSNSQLKTWFFCIFTVNTFFKPLLMVFNLNVSVSLLGLNIPSSRGDIDTLVFAIAAIFFLTIYEMNKNRSARLLAILNVLLVLSSTSRVGIIAFSVAFMIFVWKKRSIKYDGLASSTRNAAPKKFLNILEILTALLVLALSFFLNFIERIKISFERLGFLGSEESLLYVSAQNTWNARFDAWASLLDYIFSDFSRVMFGSGPGSDALGLSGARVFLSGKAEVLSPHNSFLFLVMQFGFFGLFVWVCCTIFLFKWTNKLVASENTFFVFMKIPAIVLMLLACLTGVILESPNGAVLLSVFLSFPARHYYQIHRFVER